MSEASVFFTMLGIVTAPLWAPYLAMAVFAVAMSLYYGKNPEKKNVKQDRD